MQLSAKAIALSTAKIKYPADNNREGQVETFVSHFAERHVDEFSLTYDKTPEQSERTS